MADLTTWIGRQEVLEDLVTAFPVRALSATLDRPDAVPLPGDLLPPLWHWLYFLPVYPRSELGPDGHARRGGFLPPVPLPRRMWAGGRLWFHAPIRIGQSLRRTSTIAGVTEKDGRTGKLVFVLVRHEITGPDGLAIVEEHDIVYREAAGPHDRPAPPLRAPAAATWHRAVVPDDVLLFRYSALTFNGHRIHYDRRYVTTEEGYPGLIVHGPLIATLLVDLQRCESGAALESFSFRAIRPLFDLAPFAVCGERSGAQVRLWAQDSDGNLTMEAEAVERTGATP